MKQGLIIGGLALVALPLYTDISGSVFSLSSGTVSLPNPLSGSSLAIYAPIFGVIGWLMILLGIFVL